VHPDNSAPPTVDADGLRVDRVEHGSVVVYQVSGEIDTLTAPHLDRALTSTDDRGSGVSHVVLDLSAVPFLSSAGLSILVEHHTRCRRDDMGFAVVAAQRAVSRAIEITALDRIIPLFDNVSDAVRAAG
jgi:anti-sigma B factor antagonist